MIQPMVSIRTCLGCGKKASKTSMLRFVWYNLYLKQDDKGFTNGRGVYSCDNESCIQALVNNPRKVAGALRCPAIKAQHKPLSFKVSDKTAE